MWRVLLLLGCSLLLVGCQSSCSWLPVCDAPVVPVSIDVLLDATPGSPGRDPAKVRDTMIVACQVAARETGEVRVHVLGSDVSTTRLVWDMTISPSPDTSTQGRERYEQSMGTRCSTAAAALIPDWLRLTPALSPVFAGVTKVAMTSADAHRRFLVVISDRREEAGLGRSFECGPLPTETTTFIEELRKEGILPIDSLKGFEKVVFLYSTVTPVEGGRCVQDLARYARLKDLWTVVIVAAGGQPQFFSDRLTTNTFDPPTTKAFLIPGVVGVLFLPWAIVRSLRVKYTAWRDKKRGGFAPAETIVMIIRRCPFFNPSRNPTHRKWADLLASATERGMIAREEVRYYRDLLAQYLPMWVLVTGLSLFLLMDWLSNTVLIKDVMPMAAPERVTLALLAAAGTVLATWWLRRQAGKRERTWLLYVAGGLYAFVAIGITAARLQMISATRTLTFGDIGITTIALLTVLGTPWLCDLAIAQIEIILADWRKLQCAKKDLRKAEHDEAWARRHIDHIQALRDAWFGEAERYAAQYLTVHRNTKGPNPSPPLTIGDVMDELDRDDQDTRHGAVRIEEYRGKR